MLQSDLCPNPMKQRNRRHAPPCLPASSPRNQTPML
jgi:hypothetical protein